MGREKVRFRKYQKIAQKFCNNSTHAKHKMAAVIIRGGAIIAKAANKGIWGEHAEKRALQSANDPRAFKGGIIIIARSNNKMSKPCEECFNLIKSAGIKKIIYLDWEGDLVIEKV